MNNNKSQKFKQKKTKCLQFFYKTFVFGFGSTGFDPETGLVALASGAGLVPEVGFASGAGLVPEVGFASGAGFVPEVGFASGPGLTPEDGFASGTGLAVLFKE